MLTQGQRSRCHVGQHLRVSAFEKGFQMYICNNDISMQNLDGGIFHTTDGFGKCGTDIFGGATNGRASGWKPG